MRYSAIILAYLLLTSCDLAGSANRTIANDQGDSGPKPPVVEARAGGSGGCALTWEGSPVSPEQVLERAAQAVERDIERQGGIAAVEELAPVDIRVDDAVPYSCFAGLLRQMQRAGFADVRLAALGSDGAGESVATFDLNLPALDGTEPPVAAHRNMVGIDAAGQMTWNGADVDRGTLRQYVDLTTTMRPQPRLGLEASPETPYRQIAIVLAVARDAGVEVIELPGNVLGSNDGFIMPVGLRGLTPPE